MKLVSKFHLNYKTCVTVKGWVRVMKQEEDDPVKQAVSEVRAVKADVSPSVLWNWTPPLRQISRPYGGQARGVRPNVQDHFAQGHGTMVCS